MKKQIRISLTIATLATVGYFSLSTLSRAQTPANETMEQKVIRLEKEVVELRQEIANLKRTQPVLTFSPNYWQSQPPSPTVPGTPFEFNGKTYYQMPLNKHLSSTYDTHTVPKATTLFVQPRK